MTYINDFHSASTIGANYCLYFLGPPVVPTMKVDTLHSYCTVNRFLLHICRNGSYTFSQMIDDTQGGYLYLADEEGVTSKYTFQMQICGNVDPPASKACNMSSPIYMVRRVHREVL